MIFFIETHKLAHCALSCEVHVYKIYIYIYIYIYCVHYEWIIKGSTTLRADSGAETFHLQFDIDISYWLVSRVYFKHALQCYYKQPRILYDLFPKWGASRSSNPFDGVILLAFIDLALNEVVYIRGSDINTLFQLPRMIGYHECFILIITSAVFAVSFWLQSCPIFVEF